MQKISNPEVPIVYFCPQCDTSWVIGENVMRSDVSERAFSMWPHMHVAQHPGHQVESRRLRHDESLPQEGEIIVALSEIAIHRAEAFGEGLLAGREGAVTLATIGVLTALARLNEQFSLEVQASKLYAFAKQIETP